jgi:hypothetical protein
MRPYRDRAKTAGPPEGVQRVSDTTSTKELMPPPLKFETTTLSLYRRSFSTVMLFSSLTLTASSSSYAQGVIPYEASTAAAIPAKFLAPTVDFVQLDQLTATAGNSPGSSSSTDENLSADSHEPSNEVEVAPIYAKFILPGVVAQPIGSRDKAVIGLRDLYTPYDFGGFFIAAGYSHVRNSQPNYGTDSGAFGERLGAAAIGETAQGVFTDIVFAPLLHEDPRYYVEGPQYGFIHRVVYAATRPLITRTDSGRRSVNGANLLAYASAAALSRTYYPQINRNFRDTIESFGGSIGGESLDFLIREFSIELAEKMHLVKR